jgi:hypothetical protein
MFYHIDKIRGVTLNRVPAIDADRRLTLQKFMNSKNLIEIGIFRKMYTYDSAVYIDEETFIKYLNVLRQHFGLKAKSAIYAKCHVPVCEDSFAIENIEQLREFEDLRKSVNIEKNKQRSAKMSLLNQPLPTNFENKKLMAIDFEFIPMGNDVEPVEMGITIEINGMRACFNYSFVNTTKENFNFGKTINVNKSSILSIFEEHFSGTDYLVGHNIQSEFKVLTQFGIDERLFENVKFIDTANVTKNEFHFLNSDHVKNETASLRTSLRTLNIPYTSLHVAGNDSAYTLDVLNQMVHHKLNFEPTKAKQKIQVTSPFKKQS